MAKILGVCSSPRKKSATEYMIKIALGKAQSLGVDTEYISLRNRKINPCIHCDKCIREQSTMCILWDDDMKELYDKFYQADGYIFGSPVYEMGVNSQMAAFFDRFRAVWMILQSDYKYFYNKTGGALAVGGARSGGQEFTILRIHNFFSTMGITIATLGAPQYNGATGWTKGGSFDAILEDETGLQQAKMLGERVALTVQKLNSVWRYLP